MIRRKHVERRVEEAGAFTVDRSTELFCSVSGFFRLFELGRPQDEA